MAQLPTGTVTFLFTDIEGSTRLWEEHPEAMRQALVRHDTLLTQCIQRHGGIVIKSRGEGDSLFAVFGRAIDATTAATAAQQALFGEAWPVGASLRVRMALHTGDADLRDGDYLGPAVNRCARLRAAAHGGQVLLSHAAQELVADQLPPEIHLKDLGECRLRDLIRPERVFQVLHPGLPQQFPPLATLDLRPNNLPAQPNPLLGREAELEALRCLLQRDEVRLVTLTGPGGTGKTRLGLQVAAELLDEFANGVYFVDLSPISDPLAVASALAQPLGVRPSGPTPLWESLKEHLREQHQLLVLDNFEQVLAAAPLVTELLAAAPRLKVLVTSRARLRLRGEQEFPVPPLRLPDLTRRPDLKTLLPYPAVELFIQRALAVRPNFCVTDENAPAVAEICCRLDGLPLAIELAAAHLRLFSPEALLARLQNRLKLLVGGPRDLPARQQTLREAIAWSYDLLSAPEQRLFRRLSVFVGGCTFEAAEAICNPDGELELDVLEGITSLVDHSLLRQGDGRNGEPRFTMLETVREFGRACLAASTEEAAIRQRHAALFLALAEEAEPQLTGDRRVEWLDRLEADLPNLSTALVWSYEVREVETGMRLAGALRRFWDVRSRGEVTEELLTQLLALPEAAARTETRARALLTAADFHKDWGARRERLQEALSIYRELGNQRGIARALLNLGWVTIFPGEWASARAYLEESLPLFRELKDRAGLTEALHYLGTVAHDQGDYERATTLHQESFSLAREAQDTHRLANAQFNLGYVAWLQQDYDRANVLYRKALALYRKESNTRDTNLALAVLARVALNQGDLAQARALCEESLAIYRHSWAVFQLAHVAHREGDAVTALSLFREALTRFAGGQERARVRECLDGLAGVFATLGQPERAARMFGAAEALRAAIGVPLPAGDRPEYDRNVAAARAQLSEERFAAVWTEGRAMPLEAAVAYALEEPSDG